MAKQSKQSGFSIVEAVVIIAVIGVIGAAGWFVYQHNRVKPTGATGDTQTTNQGTQQTTTTLPANQTTVKVPELSIQITVPNEIKDLTYKVSYSGTFKNGQKGVDAFFSTTALTAVDPKCDTSFGPLGTLTMGEGQYPSNDPTSAIDYGGNLVKQFPTFFISYTGPQAGCSENSNALNAMSKFKSDFQLAFSTIQVLN